MMDENYIMLPNDDPQPVYRRACLEDFLDKTDDTNKYNNYNKYSQSTISKNQQEFGHRKRIKP